MSRIRNLDEIRARDPKLFEALTDILRQAQSTEQQTNSNPHGEPVSPPAVNGVKVSGRDGFLHVAIQDNNQIYRGIRYYVEHADNPQFTNPQVVALHDARNATIPVGGQTRYVRAYSAYSSSAPSRAVYHGDETAPLPVNGGGSGLGPQFLASEGSGTGTAGQGLQGPGTNPFRSFDGKPPVR